MITCKLDSGVCFKHPQDILMASFETGSRLASSPLLAELYTIDRLSILDLINDL